MSGCRWWWVRHGPTHERALTGWRDVPADLSDGAALARLRAALPAEALLISSDLRRARATASALAGRQTRLPDAPELREMDFGAWDGLTASEVAARDPALSRAFWEMPGEAAPPGGESWNALCARVDRFVDALSARHPGGEIVAVAHMGVILSQLRRALGDAPDPARAALARQIAPLSITRLRHDGGRWQAEAVNLRP